MTEDEGPLCLGLRASLISFFSHEQGTKQARCVFVVLGEIPRVRTRRTSFYFNEIAFLQLITRDWVSPVIGDVFQNEATFIYFARLRRNDWLLGRLS